jgi:hypothetical protein
MADGLLAYWTWLRFLGVPLNVPVADMVNSQTASKHTLALQRTVVRG